MVKQLEKKDYAYRCNEPPIQPYCNRELCQTRKFGIGAAVSDMAVANLRIQLHTTRMVPRRKRRTTRARHRCFQNQTVFQKACIEQLNFMPQTMPRRGWEGRINQLMKEMAETDGARDLVSQSGPTFTGHQR